MEEILYKQAICDAESRGLAVILLGDYTLGYIENKRNSRDIMKKIALYPGTFDPITHGHVNIIQRGLSLFDEIIVAVSVSAGKNPLFPLKERIDIVQQVFSHSPRIQVISFSGLLVDLMHEQNIKIILRGIRGSSDLEYEFQLANMNQAMKPDIETVFLKAAPQYANVSSSIVREIIKMGKERSLGDLSLFVPEAVIDAFQQLEKS
ncbi:MAG: coaD [Gammaproteobacteria bacterium]|jgi:pantetheine-phosphate adenylyltransferase|nr:coaD [Gammaproteobacteria bacterium]